MPDKAWANRMMAKYGRNIPKSIAQEVENIMMNLGYWESRRGWSDEDWSRFYYMRGIKENNLIEKDLNSLPLLRAELRRAVKNYHNIVVPKPFGKIKQGTVNPFFFN
jgi:hypothetical protein